MKSVIEYERSVTLLRLDYLVYSLNNCVDNTSTKIGLNISVARWFGAAITTSNPNKGGFFFLKWRDRRPNDSVVSQF